MKNTAVEIFLKSIGKRVTELRIKRFGEGHGSKKQYAEFLGISEPRLKNYENGRFAWDFIFLLSAIENISIKEIVFGPDNQTHHNT